jgi:hypothetical protein
VGLLAPKVSTVVDKCCPATPIDHASAGAARLGAAGDSFPSVMQFAPRGAAGARGRPKEPYAFVKYSALTCA